jgi:hypothetical protein
MFSGSWQDKHHIEVVLLTRTEQKMSSQTILMSAVRNEENQNVYFIHLFHTKSKSH